MGNGDVFDGDASVFIEVPKVMANKRSSEVGDDAVRETESVDDIFEELDCFLCSGRNKRFVFDPLEELVNDNIHIPKTTWHCLERPDHVQSPTCERPRNWDGLQFLRRHVNLLGEKMTSFTTSDEVFCISDGHGPIKNYSESFVDQVSGGRVIATGTKVDFKK